METFIAPKELVENPYYRDQRQKLLAGLGDDIAEPAIHDGLQVVFTFGQNDPVKGMQGVLIVEQPFLAAVV
mgnify:CR=1 FL=1